MIWWSKEHEEKINLPYSTYVNEVKLILNTITTSAVRLQCDGGGGCIHSFDTSHVLFVMNCLINSWHAE